MSFKKKDRHNEIKKCEVCGSSFEAKRSSAKYCASKCRKKAYRQNNPEKIKEDNRKRYRRDGN